MATVTRDGVAGTRRLVARGTRDRELLRRFLERDRLFAAYALADTDDAEWERTRWGAAFDGEEPVAVVMEYRGVSPQPLFVMGDPAGVSAILRDTVRTRIAYRLAPGASRACGARALPRGCSRADGAHGRGA